jgi:hypothetical protein
MRGVAVEVSARKFTVPFECPCCGAPPNDEVSIVAKSSAQRVLVPYCKRCLAHARALESSGVASAGVMVLGILAAIVVAVLVALWLAALVFVLAAVIGWSLRTARRRAAEAGRGASCATAGFAFAYQGWSGTTSSFVFASPTFAARFAEQNDSVLANVSPQLRKLVDGYHRARLAIPTPAVAAGVAPPPLTVRDWIARLESTEGTVARRVQLSRALEMVEDAHPRRELVQTVARIELAPLLARLQHLTSPAAKRSLLSTSIEEVRADNIPDELQAAELRELEARLAELA